jgi:2-oxoglutarate dehydrogenase E2 component (dihydrolipoamide succinyltransferase)
MAESISEGTLKTWQKKVGDSIAADEEVATIETDKVGTIPQAFPMTSVSFLLPSISAPVFRNLSPFRFDSLTFLMSVPFIGM